MARVLLLEDDDHLAESVTRVLEAADHSVTRFRNVREADPAIPPIGFDVLLCDYELRDPNELDPSTGLDFLREVERCSFTGLSTWTTILWSGRDLREAVAESGLKIDHVITKGFSALSAVEDAIAGASR